MSIEEDAIQILGFAAKKNGIHDTIEKNLLDAAKIDEETFYQVCLEHFYQFIFIIIDKRKSNVHIIKDPTGCYPCYFTLEEEKIFLSDSIESLVQTRNTVTPNLTAMHHFIYFEVPWKPETLFNEIISVINGSITTLDPDTNTYTQSNQLSLSGDNNNRVNFSELRRHIATAHDRRVGSNNALFLSGGIDSQVMSIILKKDLGLSNLSAFNFYVAGADHTETAEAIETASELNIPLHLIEVSPNKEIELEKFALQNSPYLSSICLDTVVSSEHIDEQMTFFAGQDTRLHTPAISRLDKIFWDYFMRSPVARNIGGVALKYSKPLAKWLLDLNSTSKSSKFDKLIDAFDDPAQFLIQRYFHISPLCEGHVGDEAIEQLRDTLCKSLKLSNRDLYNEIVIQNWRKQYSFDIEYMLQVCSKRNHHCVLPFYDYDLSIYSATLDFNLASKHTKGREGHSSKSKFVNKFILREAFKEELNSSLIFREKAVCATNHLFFNNGLRNELNNFIYHNRYIDTKYGTALELSKLISIAQQRDGCWGPEDNGLCVTIFNAMIVCKVLDLVGCPC